MTSEIALGFLIVGLFFPRFTLFFAYLFGAIPPNTVHIITDFFGAVFVPRLLISFYCFGLDYHVWGMLFLIFGLFEALVLFMKSFDLSR